MEIYTGNFANVKKYESANIFCISIALSCKYFNGLSYNPLSPEWSYMNDSRESYIKKFNLGLEKLNLSKILNDFKMYGSGKDVVLLCHEKEGDFCHRRLVAEWMEKELGIEVAELGNMKPKEKKATHVQGNLF